MADMFAEKMVRKVINDIIDNKYDLSDTAHFKILVKRLLNIYPAGYLYQIIEDCVEEVADKQWFEHKFSEEEFDKIFIKENKPKRIFHQNNELITLINKRLSITQVAKNYGLNVDRKGFTQCPFHYDTDPSLKLNSEKNLFYCFGCHCKGDIITFIKKMEENNYGYKESSTIKSN